MFSIINQGAPGGGTTAIQGGFQTFCRTTESARNHGYGYTLFTLLTINFARGAIVKPHLSIYKDVHISFCDCFLLANSHTRKHQIGDCKNINTTKGRISEIILLCSDLRQATRACVPRPLKVSPTHHGLIVFHFFDTYPGYGTFSIMTVRNSLKERVLVWRQNYGPWVRL